MTTARVIPVANDNRPVNRRLAFAAGSMSAVSQDISQTVNIREVLKHHPHTDPGSANETPQNDEGRVSIGRLTALLYQVATIGLLILAMSNAADPVAIAGLAMLSSLGGICALIRWFPKTFMSRVGRAMSAIFTTLTATFAMILILPADIMSGLQNPLLIATIAFAAIGTIFRLRLPCIAALSGLGILLWQSAIFALPTTVMIQFGCVLALVALGAYRTRSVVIAACLTLFAIGLFWLSLTQTSLHSVQAFGAVGNIGAALWAVGLLETDQMDAVLLPGVMVTMGASITIQFALSDPAMADTFLQPTAPQTYLAALLVAAQGIFLFAQLCRWLRGQIGWLGVFLTQLALAAAVMVIIDPTALERLIAIPSSVDMPLLYMLCLGAVTGAIAAFGAWDSWFADHPVRMGGFAMIFFVQMGLMARLAFQSFDLTVLTLLALTSAACAVLLCRQLRASKITGGYPLRSFHATS